MKYVLGFAFDDLGRVALIKKLRPSWQANRFNGIGGKIEEGESSHDAMSREFYEETGVLIPAEQWQFRGLMQGPDWIVLVFTTTTSAVRNVRDVTDECVHLVPIWSLRSLRDEMIENVLAIIQLCMIPPAAPSMVTPLFALNYGTV